MHMGLLAIDACSKARCVDVNCKRQRRMLAKLRGGTAALIRIETAWQMEWPKEGGEVL